jgi:hypothetical protein
MLAISILALAAAAIGSLRVEAAAGGRHCPHGVKACSAAEVGQPCDPQSPGVICSAQADGSYCCLAYAP